MSIEEHVHASEEEIVDAKQIKIELVILAWRREVHLNLHLNE